LKGISFELKPGTVVGFLGANGAGKTTFIKILMNFISKDSGDIIFNEEMGKNPKEIAGNIGFLPERPYFYPDLTGREFVYLANKLSGLSKNEIEDKIIEWANTFKIDFALDRRIRSYSKGMLQRLGFLSTLVHDPKLIILDEPLSGLDPLGRKDLKEVIRKVRDEGKTVFFSSHIISDVEQVSDDIIFLKNGQVEYAGPLEVIKRRFSKDYYEIEIETNKVDLLKDYEIIYSKNSINHMLKIPVEHKKSCLKFLTENNIEIMDLQRGKNDLESILYKEI
jgi:ABC-2 type transport system ATP-binding protein